MDIFERVAREHAAAKARISSLLTLGSEWIDGEGRFCGLVTADHEDRSKVRLTVFDAQGPWGHRTRANLAALVEVIMDEFGYEARVEPGIVDRMVRIGEVA